MKRIRDAGKSTAHNCCIRFSFNSAYTNHNIVHIELARCAKVCSNASNYHELSNLNALFKYRVWEEDNRKHADITESYGISVMDPHL